MVTDILRGLRLARFRVYVFRLQSPLSDYHASLVDKEREWVSTGGNPLTAEERAELSAALEHHRRGTLWTLPRRGEELFVQ